MSQAKSPKSVPDAADHSAVSEIARTISTLAVQYAHGSTEIREQLYDNARALARNLETPRETLARQGWAEVLFPPPRVYLSNAD